MTTQKLIDYIDTRVSYLSEEEKIYIDKFEFDTAQNLRARILELLDLKLFIISES